MRSRGKGVKSGHRTKTGFQVALSKNIGLNIGAIFRKYRANIGKMVK